MKTIDKEKLIEENLGLVGYTLSLLNVRELLRKNDRLTYEDLFQEGCLALCNAAMAYDSKKGAFSTLAVISIKRHIIGLVRKESGSKRYAHSSAISIETEEGISLLDKLPGKTVSDMLSYTALKEEVLKKAEELGVCSEARAMIYSQEEKITLAKACRELGLIYKTTQKRIQRLKKVLTSEA